MKVNELLDNIKTVEGSKLSSYFAEL